MYYSKMMVYHFQHMKNDSHDTKGQMPAETFVIRWHLSSEIQQDTAHQIDEN